ncbi:MAG: ATP-dependent helicase [Verrucomicrobia bacterium]|nr:ATP-dependent helicase [Verrucomicrobiota bacterium]MBV8375540.1 ATP-dependent helicase [Verrucomicrobiota bacterium]
MTSSSIDYRAQLNDQQHEAVTSGPGPALVLAGAGSGKTRTLTYRVAWLLDNGVEPESILLLTFTNKAAREMVARVTDLLPMETRAIWGGTFHSIGNRLLRRHVREIGFRPGFSILDREDQEDLLAAVVGSSGLDSSGFSRGRFPTAEVLGDLFSFAVNTDQPVAQVIAKKYPWFAPICQEIEFLRKRYEERKQADNVVDFDDLLLKTVQLLQEKTVVAEFYQRHFQFILVDEYQDTNKLQSEFIDLLAARHQSVMVVGDDAQSIYSWRGANYENILDFPKRYPKARIYRIETNYRSVPEIVALANASIQENRKQFTKTLHAYRGGSETKPALVALDDNNRQALYVARRVLELREEGFDLNSIAVLYRAHFQSLEVQLALTRAGIPFTITSGLRFFEQAHIRDIAAFMKFAVNPADEVAFKRIARLLPGVAVKTAEKLWDQLCSVRESEREDFKTWLGQCRIGQKPAQAWQQLCHTLDEIAPGRRPEPPAKMIRIILEAMYEDYLRAKYANYEQRRDDLVTLQSFAQTFEDPVDFLSQLSLMAAADTEGSRTTVTEWEKVTLSSIHQAKGLEWRVVFVIWLTDGMFPTTRSLTSPDAVEEERRLFYVAATRARDQLYLTYPYYWANASPENRLQRPSRFLKEIPVRLVREMWVGGV